MTGLPLLNVRDFWENGVGKWPRQTAVIGAGRAYTYGEADAIIRRLRGHLAAHGLAKGDRIAMAMPNCVEFYFAYWAAVHLGAIVVPVNTRLKADEMRHVLGSTESCLCLAHASLWPPVQEALAGLTCVREVFGAGFQAEGVTPFEPLLTQDAPAPDLPDIAGDDLVLIMHTSGTTGVPKGVVITHENILYNVKNCLVAHSWRHEDRHLLVVPMFHATALYSMLPGSAYLGSTVVIAPEPDLKLILDLIEQHRCTTFIGVPMMFHMLTMMPGLAERDLASLKAISYAGSPMPPSTIRRLRQRFPGVELRNFFGLSETLSVTHVLPDEDADGRPESIGKVLPDVGMAILDEDGHEVPSGEVGELCFRRENVTQGYWGRPGLLEESCVGPWFRTGDLALVDADGYVYLRGRKKDMIIVGGENVYALEVETALINHEQIKEVAVVGIPATGVRESLGELIKAVVVPEGGARLTAMDVKRYCAEHLTTYKVPHVVEFRDALPRNPGGKVVKRLLV
jgi:acyl-CoA synthetase (AMP-forming)/AMP-acid ligase II